ncbi:hypothetical protein KSP39_PZI012550 [Platanthera zijinensis]|uniref:Uncharacterized protein n=1 Tax=Platanthera zijinensis TaxID=2320716 RepID=A0AAP0G4W9_9ASPA
MRKMYQSLNSLMHSDKRKMYYTLTTISPVEQGEAGGGGGGFWRTHTGRKENTGCSRNWPEERAGGVVSSSKAGVVVEDSGDWKIHGRAGGKPEAAAVDFGRRPGDSINCEYC